MAFDGPAQGGLPAVQDSAGQRQCHGMELEVFCSPQVVQEVIDTAKGTLVFFTHQMSYAFS